MFNCETTLASGCLAGTGQELYASGSPHITQATQTYKRIALGIDDYLDDFATKHQAESWKQFAADDPNRWRYRLIDLFADPGVEILFNLTGVEVGPGLTRASLRLGGGTDWELLRIRQDPLLRDRVKWIDRDEVVSHPY